MTREFNKQQRYGSHSPYSNPNSSSHSHEDERSPRPARPRLNRETVDRAWENGAANRHPEYRPRSQGQSPRNSWQKRPYGNNTQGSHKPPYGNGNDQRARHDYRDRYNQDSQHSDSYGKNQPRHAQGYRSNEGRYNNSRPNYQPSSQNRSAQSPYQDQQRGRYEQNRFQGQAYNGPTNKSERPGYPPRFRQQPEQYNERQGNQQRKPYDQSGTQKRYPQNRSGYQNQHQDPYATRFEGDYERFTHEHGQGNPRQQRQGPSFQQKSSPRRFRDDRPAPERHVTRLADGRVLKGSRPNQRRSAHFWTDVSNDASQILDQQQDLDEAPTPIVEPVKPPVQSPPASTRPDTEEPGSKPQQHKSSIHTQANDTQPKKPIRRVASAARRKKAIGTGKPAATRPSQRGFKWPTSDG